MRVLVIGAGGREQAIAWACQRHGHDVVVADELPSDLGPELVDLVIPGPESALVAGAADRCAELGIPCFGPTSGLAQLEASKGFARELSASLGIPGPRFARFDRAFTAEAIAWWHQLGAPVVVKADGLAAGKGVIVPEQRCRDRAAIEIDDGTVRARGADERAGVLPARAVRREDGASRCRSRRTTSASARVTPG